MVSVSHFLDSAYVCGEPQVDFCKHLQKETSLNASQWTLINDLCELIEKKSLLCAVERKIRTLFLSPTYKFGLQAAGSTCLRHRLEAALAN